MDPRTFLGRRGLRPFESAVACLVGWELRFDLPIGPGERGVANVVRSDDSQVWGVCYRLGHGDAGRLDRSEGVPRAYRHVAVAVRRTDGSEISAYTLASARGRDGRKPSRRYMRLLLAGARHHGLPAEWVATLRAFELAIDERDPQIDLFDFE